MSRRILMATVATLALAAPAAAHDQSEAPIDTELKAIQLAENSQAPLRDDAGGSTPLPTPADQTEGATAAPKPPVTAEEQPAAPPAADQAEGARETPELPTTAEQPAEAPGEQELTEEAPPTPPADMAFIQVQEAEQFLANGEVIGQDVINIMDEEVGEIADLVMDREQKLVGVVLSVGGFLGLGEKWVAVPVDQIDFTTADQPARLLAAVTEEQLKNAPDFMTREAVEAEKAAEQAQQQAMQQQPLPSPATPSQ
jgi:PRC-barrel domain